MGGACYLMGTGVEDDVGRIGLPNMVAAYASSSF